MASKIPSIRIDIVSDVVWPWCYVGKRNLERAVASIPRDARPHISIHWQPFQLVPTSQWGRFPAQAHKVGINKLEFYNEKFGSDVVQTFVPRLQSAFAKAGIEGEYSLRGNVGPTVAAHRVATYAGEKEGLEKQNAFMESMFKAYFIESATPCDPAVILNCAKEADLNLDACAEILAEDSTLYATETERDMRTFGRGVNGVPHFIISNGDKSLSFGGAQPPESFIDAFETLGVQL